MKTIKKVSALLLLLFFGGCDSSDVQKEDISSQLTETRWELVGFVNELTGEIDKLDVLGFCPSCYTIYFETDSTYTALAPVSFVKGLYFIDTRTKTIDIQWIGGTDVAELPDGIKFRDALSGKNAFELSDKELKIYYDKNFHLQFKRIEDETE